jgi:hypothetical protein
MQSSDAGDEKHLRPWRGFQDMLFPLRLRPIATTVHEESCDAPLFAPHEFDFPLGRHPHYVAHGDKEFPTSVCILGSGGGPMPGNDVDELRPRVVAFIDLPEPFGNA